VGAAAKLPPLTPEALVELIAKTIADHKGVEPVILEVKGLCSFADYFIVCSGGSRRHVLALAEHLEQALTKAGAEPLGVEGMGEGQWVLMDYNDVVIHIFSQPLREFYNLEGLWAEAPQTGVEGAAHASSPSLSPQEAIPNPGSDAEHIRHE
jgi:ribosome-associated protein